MAFATTGESPKVAALKVETLLGTGAEIGDRTIIKTFDIGCMFVAYIFLNEAATPCLNQILI